MYPCKTQTHRITKLRWPVKALRTSNFIHFQFVCFKFASNFIHFKFAKNCSRDVKHCRCAQAVPRDGQECFTVHRGTTSDRCFALGSSDAVGPKQKLGTLSFVQPIITRVMKQAISSTICFASIHVL